MNRKGFRCISINQSATKKILAMRNCWPSCWSFLYWLLLIKNGSRILLSSVMYQDKLHLPARNRESSFKPGVSAPVKADLNYGRISVCTPFQPFGHPITVTKSWGLKAERESVNNCFRDPGHLPEN